MKVEYKNNILIDDEWEILPELGLVYHKTCHPIYPCTSVCNYEYDLFSHQPKTYVHSKKQNKWECWNCGGRTPEDVVKFANLIMQK